MTCGRDRYDEYSTPYATGADPRLKDETGRTPLQLARQKGHRLVAEALGG